uniref:Putative secreted peptide n=1 Tax=Anopheles braziliensis TaxID=58242 RepID=A0A2M3ZXP6_9DIPT
MASSVLRNVLTALPLLLVFLFMAAPLLNHLEEENQKWFNHPSPFLHEHCRHCAAIMRLAWGCQRQGTRSRDEDRL